MKHNDQLLFIDELFGSVRDTLRKAILAGKVPEEWDGIELRQWIADKFHESTYEMDRKRRHEYQNTVMVNNL